MNNRNHARNSSLLIIMLSFFLLLHTISALAADGKIEISQTANTTFPISINGAQGSSYLLTSDLNVPLGKSGLSLSNSDGITIDLNGFTISGAGPGYGHGIIVDTCNMVCIKNGTIKNFGQCGIYIKGPNYGNGHIVENIRAHGNFLSGGDSSWHAGISVRNCIVRNCTVSSNNFNGISITGGIALDNLVNDNLRNGIYAGSSLVSNNVVSNNGYYGIEGGGIIKGNLAYGNSIAGIYPGGGLILENKCSGSEYGIFAETYGLNRIEGNFLSSNSAYGLSMRSWLPNYYLKNTLSDNTLGPVQKYGASEPHKDGGTIDPALQNVIMYDDRNPPNVIGMVQADAEAAILSRGLTVGVITNECSDTISAGSVTSQNPTSDMRVPSRTPVNLVVSTGPCL